MTKLSELSIGELANQAQIAPSALRYYESIGLLRPTKRINGQRRYTEQALSRLSFIKLAQKAGFTGKEIKILLAGFETDVTPPISQWEFLARQKITELDEMIEQAHNMKKILEDALQCGCFSYTECETLYKEQGCCGNSANKKAGD